MCKCGIHTNVKKIVDGAGGIDLEYAASVLMEEYGVEDTSENFDICIAMCRDLNIRDKIDTFGFDTVMNRTRVEEYRHRIQFAQMLGFIER